jgi:hypothetical protein
VRNFDQEMLPFHERALIQEERILLEYSYTLHTLSQN